MRFNFVHDLLRLFDCDLFLRLLSPLEERRLRSRLRDLDGDLRLRSRDLDRDLDLRLRSRDRERSLRCLPVSLKSLLGRPGSTEILRSLPS